MICLNAGLIISVQRLILMPHPVIDFAEADVDIQPHPTRRGHVLFTVDAFDGRHFEHALTIAEFEALIAKFVRMRRLI